MPEITSEVKPNGLAQRIRVVLLRGRQIRTGGERYLAEVHSYLEQAGVPVTPVWVDDLPFRAHRFGLAADCLASNLWFFSRIRQVGDLADSIVFEDYSLHPRLWLCNSLLRRGSGRPRIAALMQSSLFYHEALQKTAARKLDGWMARRFFQQTDLVFCNSQFTQREVSSLKIPSLRSRVVYCGFTGIGACSQPVRSAVHSAPINLLFVGQCVPVKGLRYLIQAVAQLSQHDLVLHVVGNTGAEPVYFDSLIELVTRLGLESRILFHGHIAEPARLASFYRQADIFVLPSLVEGFGMALLEALAHGLPIVATNVGAIPELVADGVSGMLVPPANGEALATAIGALIDSPATRERLGATGLASFRVHQAVFTWPAVGASILQGLIELSGAERQQEVNQS